MGGWTFGLAGWVIMDGVYDDFARGQRRDFAVQARLESVTLAPAGARPSAAAREGADYDFVGVVACSKRGSWAIDLGIMCYGNDPLPRGIRVGDAVAGAAYLAVEAPDEDYPLRFFLAAPPMTYSWNVDRIRLEATPFVEVGHEWVRDEAKIEYVAVDSTTAGVAPCLEEVLAHYVLDCTACGPPKHDSPPF